MAFSKVVPRFGYPCPSRYRHSRTISAAAADAARLAAIHTGPCSRSKGCFGRSNISAMHHCRRRVSYGARITNGGKGVEREGGTPCLMVSCSIFARTNHPH